MFEMTQLGAGAIWICKQCNIWWGSQIGNLKATDFLSRLDQAKLLPSWESYRGWRMVAEQAPVCQECGYRIAMPAIQSN